MHIETGSLAEHTEVLIITLIVVYHRQNQAVASLTTANNTALFVYALLAIH